MTLFASPAGGAPASGGNPPESAAAPPKPPPGWSVANWPVRWKVVAIALVPMVLAMVFAGLRISGVLADADRMQRSADRAEMVPAITDYMSALDGVLLAVSAGGDVQSANRRYENRKSQLQSRAADAAVPTDVRSAVTTLVDGGQGLLEQVLTDSIGLRDQVTGYAPILLTAEDTINGLVRMDGEVTARIRAQTEGLSRAVGARGQMMMQQLLVNRGGELPDPELRTSMITLAGTEPSTLFGMSQVLGVDSPDVKKLQQQMVTRMAIMSDPEAVLPNDPALRDSIHSTDQIAARVIDNATRSVTTSLADQATERRNTALSDTALMLAAVLLALAAVWLVARSLVRPLRTLRDSALKVAHTDLEHEIAAARSGLAGSEREPAPLPVYTSEEVGQVAHAVDELHTQVLLLAGDEARLRRLVNEMFETMSRRNRSLVDQQLALIDRLERDESDPDRLDDLFRLDHLAVRMRRNGANLLVLAGARASGERPRPAALATVISAAISEVEDYRRVQTAAVPDAAVIGVAVGDTVHLVAELIDNALRYSPPSTQIRVSAVPTVQSGVLIQIVDSGLGMTDSDLRIANMRLAAGGEATPENARHMGLFVVSRLAHRHGIGVRLAHQAGLAGRGITAEVHLPPALLSAAADADQQAPLRVPVTVAASDGQRRERTPAAVATQHNGAAQHDPEPAGLPRRLPGSSGSASLAGGEAKLGSPHEPSGFAGAVSELVSDPAPVATEEDLIYQRMLSEWLVDPHELGRSTDLDWKSVWDHGWSVAAEVESVPVQAHTEHGLPVREPGVRLVPGSAPSPSAGEARHRAEPERDPDAVRASISSHFGGVRAGRSHTRAASGETPAGPDQR